MTQGGRQPTTCSTTRSCDSCPRHWRSRNTIMRLIKEGRHRARQGRNRASSTQQFCKRNNRWMEGLISAARPVAFTTNLLIKSRQPTACSPALTRTSNSLSDSRRTSRQMKWTGATTQLVAVSRVTCQACQGQSHVQDARTARSRCEGCNRCVQRCKTLVNLVRTISAKLVEKEDVDYKYMAVLANESRKRELEMMQCSCRSRFFVRLERELGAARHRPGAMRRRTEYHTDGTD